MQYKVPQNVDIADKVIAGLTLRQFIFLMFAGGAILVSKFILGEALGFLFIPVALVIAAFGVALAFLKINDRPFEVFLISATKTFLKPARRIWQKETIKVVAPKTEKPKEEVASPKKFKGTKSNLEKLAAIVDTGGNTPENEERISNLKPKNIDEPNDLNDILGKTEKSSDKLDNLFSETAAATKKEAREPTVSSFASMPVDKDQYSYDKLPLKSEEELNEIIKHADEKMTEQEENK